MTVVIDAYYSASGAIDWHNKQFQDDLNIERKIRTKDWWKQVNKSIFGMILVGAMESNQLSTGTEDIEYDPNEWLTALSYDLVDNAVKEQKRISSNTGQPRKIESTKNFFQLIRGGRSAPLISGSKGGALFVLLLKNLPTSVIFVATREVRLDFVSL